MDCKTCQHCPIWERFTPYNGTERSIGNCRCPMPLNESSPPVIWMIGSGVYKGAIGLDNSKISDCPAYKPKEQEE